MPDIKLPDGKKISFKQKVDGYEIAKKIVMQNSTFKLFEKTFECLA